MKTYKLQKESKSSLGIQAFTLFMLVIGSMYVLSTIEYSLGILIFLSILTLVFIAMFFSTIKQIEDKSEHFLEVEIDDDSLRLNLKTILFKDVEAFAFEHYRENGNYYGRIYLVQNGERSSCLYSREFIANNYLSEEMMLEIYTTLSEKYETYKQKHPEKEKKLQTSQKKLWGMFDPINVNPSSDYYSYNGSYDANIFFLLAFALIMSIPAFLVNYDTIYFTPQVQELLYKVYFLTDYKNYVPFGADVSVIAWGMFYITTIDMFFKYRFNLLFFMSYDNRLIRVGEVVLSLSVLLYIFILIAYFDGEDIVGFLAITLMLFYMILIAYLEQKKQLSSSLLFLPIFSLFILNLLALGSLI